MTTNTNLTIFDDAGDLTFRKLLPTLCAIGITGKLPEDSCITIIDRRDYDNSHYRQIARDWVERFTRLSFEEKALNRFSEKIDYYRMDFSCLEAYHRLNHYYRGNDIHFHIFYFAVAPRFFNVITRGLKLVHGSSSDKMMLERPFGENLAAAVALNEELGAFFGPGHIHHINHYLRKGMIRNVQAIRFSNPIFTDVWNSRCIESVQISALEDMGVETRGGHYDASDALKDMAQNHLFQILSIMTMEQPEEFNPKGLHDARLDIFHCLQPTDESSIENTLVLGRCEGCRSGPLVKSDSQTETYGALWFLIDNQRQKGAPFYARTGKKTEKREIELVVIFHKPYQEIEPNILIIEIQSTEDVYLQFSIKRPGDSENIIPAKMDFCQNCSLIHQFNTPKAYEHLITACMAGGRSWFSQWGQIEFSWNYVSHPKELHATKRLPVYPYGPRARGPTETNRILEQYGHSWLQVSENSCRGFGRLRQL